MTVHISGRFRINLLSNVAFLFVSVVTGLFLVPYYIENLGITAYALIPLTTSLANFLILFVEPFNNSFQRYISKHIQQNDLANATISFNTALFGMLKIIMFIIPIAILVAFISSQILEIYGITPASIFLILCSMFMTSLLNAWGASFSNILFAKNRLDLGNVIKTSQIIIQILVVVILFGLNAKTLTSYFLACALSTLVYVIALYFVSRHIFFIEISYKYYDKKLFKETFHYGAWNTVNALGNLLFLDASLILSGFILGLEAGGMYSIAVKICMLLISVCAAISYTFSPIIYECYFNRNYTKLKNTCFNAILVTGLIMSMIYAYVYVFSPYLINIWLNGSVSNLVIEPVRNMVLTLALTTPIIPVYCVSVMMLKLKIPSITTLLFGLLNVILIAILTSYYSLGLSGFVIAWGISMFMKNFMFNTWYHSKLIYGNCKLYQPYIITLAFFVLFYVIFETINRLIIFDYTLLELGGIFCLALGMLTLSIHWFENNRGASSTE